MPSKKQELVLVFETKLLEDLGPFQGVRVGPEPMLSILLDPQNNRFMPRQQAENDPAYKQIIPYIVLAGRGQVFIYRRGKRGGEDRLHDKLSIGLGGHVNPEDETLFSMGPEAYHRAVERELFEEVEIEGGFRNRIVGLINDDSDPVGRVHFGVVHLFELTRPRAKSNESPITRGRFEPLSRIEGQPDRLETWSSLLLPHLPTWLGLDKTRGAKT